MAKDLWRVTRLALSALAGDVRRAVAAPFRRKPVSNASSAGSKVAAVARPIADLKNAHPGADIYVIGSAASMNYLDPAFFLGRLTICVNFTYRRFPARYVVGKELPQVAFDDNRGRLIVSRHPFGYSNLASTEYVGPGEFYRFEHRHNQHCTVDWSVLGTDEIVVSYSTITSAIHVAAYMGAANIFLCGVDGGLLDGKVTYDGYYPEMPSGDQASYRRFVRDILPQTRELRDRLRSVYGCRVYLLSPFLDFSLEGHSFEP